jgi:hypothetical protein
MYLQSHFQFPLYSLSVRYALILRTFTAPCIQYLNPNCHTFGASIKHILCLVLFLPFLSSQQLKAKNSYIRRLWSSGMLRSLAGWYFAMFRKEVAPASSRCQGSLVRTVNPARCKRHFRPHVPSDAPIQHSKALCKPQRPQALC